ncbi:MAG: extracellular solute-binding protein [Oscillospiraceae bacterium]|nr:extracellular solute-binding protein [Oscillospiraceae bacterium]
MQKIFFAVLFAVLLTVSALPVSANAEALNGEADAINGETEQPGSAAPPYLRYAERHTAEPTPLETLTVFDGQAPVTLAEGEQREFTVFAANSGLYVLRASYSVTDDSGLKPSLALKINGETPFSEADNLLLNRRFQDAARGERDGQGNELIPAQEELTAPQVADLADLSGYWGKTLYFFLENGENSVNIFLNSGNVDFYSLVFYNDRQIKPYLEAAKDFSLPDYDGEPLYFEAENTSAKSDSTLIGASDGSSPAISPYSLSVNLLNTIGGTAWSSAGKYLEWEFQVPKDGLYRLTLKGRQAVNVGMSSYRRILIDGKTPYAELEAFAFPYSVRYVNYTLGDGGGDYLFELKSGETHTLRMEVDLGGYAEFLTDVSAALGDLNTAYRKIIMLTGSDPDPYRNYQIHKNLPDVMESMRSILERIQKIYALLEKNVHTASSATGIFGSIIKQLTLFLENEYLITSQLSQYKSNVSALSSWLMTANSQPLQLDYFVLSAPRGEIKDASASFFAQVGHSVKSFLHTFSGDYLKEYSKNNSGKVITVWMPDGQVAQNILSQLIANDFDQTHDFKVDLKLVNTSVLMAIVADKGPDIVLDHAPVEIMNYAYRNEVADLSEYPDLPEILKRFNPGAITELSYKSKVYALPTTQNYYMMYYRKDILAEMGIAPPDTWTQMVTAMAVLKKNNLTVGIPSDLNGYYMLLHQNGGQVYNDDWNATTLTTYQAIHSFETFTGFYRDHKLPLAFEAMNRLRTGEMPLVISGIALFNELTIGAPEIQGQWGMTLIPGTVLPDGTISRAEVISGLSAAILKNPEQDLCWEFLKWYTSDDIQLEFSRRKEMILGTSARQLTANLNAFHRLAWGAQDLRKLEEQGAQTVGVPTLPGAYFTSRHLSNAINRVLYSNGTPYEELTDFSKIIDKEIAKKTKELGLDQ